MSPSANANTGAAADPSLAADFRATVIFQLTALANKLSIRASQRLRKRLDVGLMEWRVVALLGLETEATPARVSQVAGVDKSVVSRAVNSLQQRGLLQVCNAQPGRQTLLRLTEEGRRLSDRGIPGAMQAEALLTLGFAPEERELLLDMLQRMTANLTRLDQAPP